MFHRFFYLVGVTLNHTLAKPNAAALFVKRINAHDVEGLIRLMTSDHIMVDSLGERFARPAIEEGWRQYFGIVPDYRVRIDRKITMGDATILIGSAGGTYVAPGTPRRSGGRWVSPAVWLARTRGGKVAEWRIYADNEPIRARMREAAGRKD